jgi:hypothetical protein
MNDLFTIECLQKGNKQLPSIVNDPNNPNGSQHTSDECPDINAKRLCCG